MPHSYHSINIFKIFGRGGLVKWGSCFITFIILSPVLSDIRIQNGCASKSICLNQFLYLRDVVRISTQAPGPCFGSPDGSSASKYCLPSIFIFLLGQS